jgi:hypothetical protein
MNIKKRFPAKVTLDDKVPTFLSDKSIDGELYAYLQSVSTVENNQTVVLKSNLPTQVKICDIIKIKSPKTLRVHLDYLISKGYVKLDPNYPDRYILPACEDVFLMLPLTTVQFLLDTVSDNVIKTYIYLFQRFKWKGDQYTFTLEELGAHLGYNITGHSRQYTMFNNILINLQNNGLIQYEDFQDGVYPKKRLLNVSVNFNEKI